MWDDLNDLTALLGSRICHDLISPLGAISNGLELLSMTGQPVSPELTLISDSVENANSKIRFFRVAYGAAPEGAGLLRSEVASILDDNYKGSRLSVVWHPQQEVPRLDVKIAFLVVQCLESSLPYGGSIEVDIDAHGFYVSAHADQMKIVPAQWGALTGRTPAIEISASMVQFGVLRQLIVRRNPPLHVAFSDNLVEVRF